MMKPIKVPNEGDDAKTYACIHWRSFPPAFAGLDETFEELRARNVLDGPDYQRHQTWEKACGQLKMDEDKCLTCPHVRKLVMRPHKVPQLVTLADEISTPAIDIPTVASMGRYRRFDMKATARRSQVEARAATQKALADSKE